MDMKFVRGTGRYLISVGWENHILQVEFKGNRRFQFGGVPEEVKNKLLRTPFPESLFQKLVRGKYTAIRVDNLPPVAKSFPDIDLDEIPF